MLLVGPDGDQWRIQGGEGEFPSLRPTYFIFMGTFMKNEV